MKRIIILKHCFIVSIYKVEELEKWHRSNLFVPLASGRWYLFHENWISENNGRRKDSKKWSETSPFAKRYEIETWLFFYHSVGRSKRQCGNICLGNIELQIRETFIAVMLSSPIRDCYGHFVLQNRIARKVIVRLMISLTGYLFPSISTCNCKCDVIIPARYRLGIRLTG